MRMVRSIIAASVAVAGLGLLTMAAVRPDAEQVKRAALQAEGETWADAHKTGLPTTLDGYAVLSTYNRRAVYKRLTVAQQGDLWRQHLVAFVTPVEELSPMQRRIRDALNRPLSDRERRIVDQAIGSIGRIYDSTLTIKQSKELAKSICDSARAAFDETSRRLIFGVLTPVRDLRPNNETGSQKAKEASLLAPLVALTRSALMRTRLIKPLSTCGCATDSCSECGTTSCSIPDCLQTEIGCGCLGRSVCAYNCTYIQ